MFSHYGQKNREGLGGSGRLSHQRALKRVSKNNDRKNSMKTIIKLSLVFAAFASSAFAGDPSARWQAELQRQQTAERNRPVTTVAVRSHRGLGERATRNDSGELRYEFRTNAHGQTTGAYVRR